MLDLDLRTDYYRHPCPGVTRRTGSTCSPALAAPCQHRSVTRTSRSLSTELSSNKQHKMYRTQDSYYGHIIFPLIIFSSVLFTIHRMYDPDCRKYTFILINHKDAVLLKMCSVIQTEIEFCSGFIFN